MSILVNLAISLPPIVLIIALWVFFMGAMVKRRKPPEGQQVNETAKPSPLLNITITPRLIGLGTFIAVALGPVFDVLKHWIKGDGFNTLLFVGGVLYGAIAGGAFYAFLAIGIWLIARFRKKDPSQHF